MEMDTRAGAAAAAVQTGVERSGQSVQRQGGRKKSVRQAVTLQENDSGERLEEDQGHTQSTRTGAHKN